MAIPVSASITQLNAEVFLQEGYELSLDAIVPSIELTGSFSPTVSKTQFYIYSYSKTLLYENLNYNADGSYLEPASGTTISNSSSSYNQFELNPIEDIYNQGYSSGNYYAVYNFIDYELGSELDQIDNSEDYNGHPYFLKEISGDRTELRIQNNFLTQNQIESYYNQFNNKINARQNADEFYVSFGDNRNFIGVNTQLEVPSSGSSSPTSILIKLYKPLPIDFQIDDELQIISKVGESQVFSVDFQPNLEFIDNLLQLKGPNYNIDIKDRVNNSTNYKNYYDLINTVSSQSYYQFNSLKDQKGVILRKNYGDWNQFVKYSSAEQRLNNFKDKLASIESASAELLSLGTITGGTTGSIDYSSSYNATSDNINQIISKFDSYEYFLYYITGSESWPKFTSTYPYTNFSVTSSEALNWFGSVNENSAYYNTGKNQIYSASRYDNSNQDYLYYLIPPFITENSSNNQYIKFVNMIGQSFDEMYLYTEAIEQVRNTNSQLTGSVLPLGLADDVIESLGYETGGNTFNSAGYNPNQLGTFPTTGSGLEYIKHYIDIASGSVVNYYDQNQSTLGYVIALADPSFPYPINNSSQEIYKRIFHNMVSLVKRKGTVTGLRQLINIWGVPNTMLRISEFGGKNKDDENDYDLWMNRYSTAFNSFATPATSSIPNTGRYPTVNANAMFPWLPLVGNFTQEDSPNGGVAVPDCIQFRFKTARETTATTNFSESLLLKRGADPSFDDEDNNGDFGIFLHQSGSQSGSFNGANTPHFNTYASMSFVISGSIAQGAQEARNIGGTNFANVYITDPIYLPFYNKEWWTVQIQRKTHISASGENNTINEFELRVGQNIYDGYDGNQIGWLGSSSLTMVGGVASASMNEAWNRFFLDPSPGGNVQIHNYHGSQVFLPGNIFPNSSYTANNTVGKADSKTVPGFDLGDTMSGSFQEFRYYRRALSASAFNDLVMNPESIQGHADSNTGPGSSYDLLSYRVPLGNELEFTNPNGSASYFDPSYITNLKQFAFGRLKPTGQITGKFVSGNSAVGSVHPSAINYTSSIPELGVGNSGLYTGSFFSKPVPTDSGQFLQPYFLNFRFNTTPLTTVTSSYVVPNNDLNYMDQPAAGIRNRIKNKIQVIDGNEYGTILSPYRSIQQEFEQSASYTEDINSLEVGFSFQNEINDDIISTFGHGVVSDAIADPRFISESSDRYPELTRIAEDYFNKYQGYPVITPSFNEYQYPKIIEKEYDYNRLIKFYESSLFKAIKNYVPARTSLSTGIIVKQHLLERNKTSATVGVSIDTPIAKTPETGSNNGILTTDPNDKYFSTGFNSGIFQENLLITSSIEMYSLTGSAGGSVNDYNITEALSGSFRASQFSLALGGVARTASFDSDSTVVQENIHILSNRQLIGTSVRIKCAPRVTISAFSISTNPVITISLFSTKRGFISEQSVTQNSGIVEVNFDEFIFSPDEEIYFTMVSNASGNTSTYEFKINTNIGGIPNHRVGPSSSLSQQAWWYIDDFTGDNKLKTTQEEFYNGEYSGSNVSTVPTQYNPYRIFESPNLAPTPIVNILQAEANSDFENRLLNGFDVDGDNILGLPTQFITGAIDPATNSFPLVVGQEYQVTYDCIQASNGARGGVAIYANRPDFDFGAGESTAFSNTSLPGGSATTGVTGALTGSFIYNPFGDSNQTGIVNPENINYAGLVPFFINIVSGEVLKIRNIRIKPIFSASSEFFFPNDGFTITPTSSFLFQNSPYNPIINNVSGSRTNERFLDMDFDPVTSGSNFTQGIPNDYTLLVSASQLGWKSVPTATNLLEFAEVPESNYTIAASANPRYKGSLLESADYNFYTGIPSESKASPSLLERGRSNTLTLFNQNKVRYANDETGSWRGDLSYGKNAVIDRYPKFFAHFKSSAQSREQFNTTTFNIDQLIEIPYNDITGEQSPKISSSLINGNNENLIPVSSTFMPGRKLAVSYNNDTKNFTFNANSPFRDTSSVVIDYTALSVGTKEIYASATEIQSKMTNQIDVNNITTTMSYNNPAWYFAPKKAYGIANTTNQQTGSFTEEIVFSRIPANNSYIDPLNVFNFPFPLQNAIEASGSLDTSVLQPLKIRQTTAGNNDQNLGISTFRPNLAGTLVNFQNTFSFLTQSNSIMNAEGNEKGFGLLELGGQIGQIQAVGSWGYVKGPSNEISSSIFNLVGGHLSLINTINHGIKNGDVIPNGDYTPVFNDFLTALYVNSAPLAASNMKLQDNVTGSVVAPFPLPVLTEEERADSRNYFTYNYNNSDMSTYKDFSEPFMIERGDEIRVTYVVPNDAELPDGTIPSNDSVTKKAITQDFTVLGYRLPAPLMQFSSSLVTDTAGSQGVPATGQTCLVTSSVLASAGVYSQGELFQRYTKMKDNNIPIFGMSYGGTNVTSDVTNAIFSGSLLSVSKIGRNRIAFSFEVHGSPSLQYTSTTSSYTIGTTNNAVRTGLCAMPFVNEISGSMGPLFQFHMSDANISGFLAGLLLYATTQPAFNFNMLEVTPDPAKLANPIPNGIIHSYTIKKRVEADDRVIVNLNQPSGSRGVITPSGDGYLIPEDLTPIQQGNVQKLINKLKSENVFTKDSDTNTIR